jgi:hypothetical protein
MSDRSSRYMNSVTLPVNLGLAAQSAWLDILVYIAYTCFIEVSWI